MANVFHPIFDEPREREGFRALRSRIGRQIGTERLGVSVWELPPGQAAYPYHAHLGEEELVVILSGHPSLRTKDGWRELEEGEAVSFLRGGDGAHQVANRTEETVRFMSVSTNGDPDLVLYPDSGKLGAAQRLPTAPGGLNYWFSIDDAVDYYVGETPPDAAAT
jgi:uncharacterized cupin superfamily protein